jgi:hypothetical protein
VRVNDRYSPSYKDVPVGPAGDLSNYSEIILTSARSAPTNTGWRSVLVTFLLAMACVGSMMAWAAARQMLGQTPLQQAAQSHLRQARDYFNHGNYTATISQCSYALDADVTLLDAYLLRAQAYQATSDKTNASFDYRAVLDLHPTDAQRSQAERGLTEVGSGP